jgi:hypothetical protein
MIKEKTIQVAVWISLVVMMILCASKGSFSNDEGGTQDGWKVLLEGRSLEGWHPLDVSHCGGEAVGQRNSVPCLDFARQFS